MAKNTYHRRKSAGLCPMCGGPRNDRAFVQCVDCRARDRNTTGPKLWDGHGVPPPTPAEIVERAAEVQAAWNPATELQRRGASVSPVEFPMVRMI